MRDQGGRRSDENASVPPEVRAAVVDAERPFVERLSRDFQLCLRYFAVTFRGQKPETLTLVGGEAYEPLYSDCWRSRSVCPVRSVIPCAAWAN
ncbi:MAG: hypothetical protein IPK83_22075 [Planctomycetes bacterium]|nr:hypothetical protein [Planctomycetota bacterium]